MYSGLLGTLLELLEVCPLLLLLLQVTNSCIWEDLWPWDLEWFLCPQLLLHFCHLLQHWEHQWCQLHYMEDWFFSVDFCCMTPKRLSIGKTKHVLILFLKYCSFVFWEVCTSNFFFVVVYRAENHPNGWGVAKYDPVNNSIGIYISTMNIFIRIAQILAMGGNRRK